LTICSGFNGLTPFKLRNAISVRGLAVDRVAVGYECRYFVYKYFSVLLGGYLPVICQGLYEWFV
jgi:hypothetical protein